MLTHRQPPRNVSGRRGGLFDSQRGQTAPPSGNRNEKTPKAFRKPTQATGSRWWRGGRSKNRVKAGGRTRHYLEAVFAERIGGAGGRRRRLESTRGSPGSEADRTRGGIGGEGRGPPEPTVGRWRRGGRVKVERAYPARTLRRFCGANRWSRRAAQADRVRQGARHQPCGGGNQKRSGRKTAADSFSCKTAAGDSGGSE